MLFLKPSSIAGVGVFTDAPIAAGAHLRLWHDDDWRLVTFSEAEADPEHRLAYETWCVREEAGYRCPLDFHRMSIGWYMNHSDTPNVRSSAALGWQYYASRDIAAGEEIVCDYNALSPVESAPEAAA